MKTTTFKFKMISALVIGFLFIAGCAKDNSVEPNSLDSPKYLISEAWVGGKLQHSRTYDNKNRLESITMYEGDAIISIAEYHYDEKGLLTQTVIGPGNQSITNLEYDALDRPLKGTIIIDGEVVQIQNFTYSKNQMVITVAGVEGGKVVQTHSYDTNGNLIELLTESGSFRVKTEFADFDDKQPFDALYDYQQQKSNPRYEKETWSTGEVTESIYEYKYNNAGYIIESNKIDKQTNKLIQKIVYTLIKRS